MQDIEDPTSRTMPRQFLVKNTGPRARDVNGLNARRWAQHLATGQQFTPLGADGKPVAAPKVQVYPLGSGSLSEGAIDRYSDTPKVQSTGTASVVPSEGAIDRYRDTSTSTSIRDTRAHAHLRVHETSSGAVPADCTSPTTPLEWVLGSLADTTQVGARLTLGLCDLVAERQSEGRDEVAYLAWGEIETEAGLDARTIRDIDLKHTPLAWLDRSRPGVRTERGRLAAGAWVCSPLTGGLTVSEPDGGLDGWTSPWQDMLATPRAGLWGSASGWWIALHLCAAHGRQHASLDVADLVGRTRLSRRTVLATLPRLAEIGAVAKRGRRWWWTPVGFEAALTSIGRPDALATPQRPMRKSRCDAHLAATLDERALRLERDPDSSKFRLGADVRNAWLRWPVAERPATYR